MVTSRCLGIAAACAAALAVMAPAAGAETLTCQVSASGSFSPSMFLVDGSGRFEFDSPSGLVNSASCSYNGGPRVPSRISSEGSFDNILCGTGWFDSPYATTTGTTIDVGMNGTNEVTSLAYRAELRSWSATFAVTRVNGRPEAGDVDGVLVLRPQHSCTFEPVPRFTADGVLTLDW